MSIIHHFKKPKNLQLFLDINKRGIFIGKTKCNLENGNLCCVMGPTSIHAI